MRAWWIGLFVVVSLLRPADVEAASVDEILGGVAKVVADRARSTAARTIKKRLIANVCGKSIELVGATSGIKRVLVVGGDSTANHDHVFVESCRQLRDDLVVLADAHVLKTVGRETVELLFRVAAIDLSEADYRKYRLRSLAHDAYDLALSMTKGEIDLDALSRTLDTLASSIDSGYADRALAPLASPANDLYTRTRAWLAKECTGTKDDHACDAFEGRKVEIDGDAGKRTIDYERHQWRHDLAKDPQQCSTWIDAHRARRELFDRLFAPGQVYAEFREGRACKKDECKRARVLFNVLDHASKMVCFDEIKSRGMSERVFRQLAYLHAQRTRYRTDLGAGSKLHEGLVGYFKKLQDLPLEGLLEEELATAIRILSRLAKAAHDDSAGLDQWLGRLESDLERLVGEGQDLRPESFERFLTEGSLSGVTRDELSRPVGGLFDEIKDALVLPYLYLGSRPSSSTGGGSGTDELTELARTHLSAITRALSGLTNPSTPRGTSLSLDAITSFFGEIASSEAREALVDAIEERSGSGGKLLDRTCRAIDKSETANNASLSCLRATYLMATLDQLGVVLRLAGDGNWVGLSLELTRRVEQLAASDSAKTLVRSLRFIRVLMSMYQAGSAEEARGIFAAALDEEASREKRYDRFSVDVAALVGVAAGMYFGKGHAAVDGPAEILEEYGSLGLYAPFGVQLSSGRIGGLLYPVDLGAYMVASSGEEPTWYEAVRVGAALYGRPSASTPLDIYVAADFAPGFGDREQRTRVLLGVVLELPLFALN